MKVLVDTSIWSLALRRRAGPSNGGDARILAELQTLLDDDRVVMVGPVRQELLSGIRDHAQFERLRERLAAWSDEALETADFERAAEAYNACRAHRIQGTPIDLLLCAWSERRGVAVFTTDRDFTRYAQVFPVALHEPQA